MIESERQIRRLGQAWGSLKEEEKYACVVFAVSDGGSGVAEDYLEWVGVDEQILETLQNKGVIESKPTWQFFQDMADDLEYEAKKIEDNLWNDPDCTLNDEETGILEEYLRCQEIADEREETPKFYLSDENFQQYILENTE